MCGIFGSVSKNGVELSLNQSSLNTLIHRGPDQLGEYFDQSVYLGHRRLSILDLSENGKQPMFNNNTAIAVNGEIYNFQELKNQLKQKYQFNSNSDSEVVLHGFSEWGIKGLLDRIDGMYAFVIYDKIEKKIYLARDRYGIKPLYYGLNNTNFTWSSELKAIEHFFSNNSLNIDYTALYDYLTYLYIPTPKTIYKNIFKLPPAHYLVLNLQSMEYNIERYWDLKYDEINITIDEASENVKSLLAQSVKEQMISDVPLGFFLSGGIDSSIVVASASKYTDNINTYSIGFDVEAHNETIYAEQVAQLFKTSHFNKTLNIQTANNNFNNLKIWYDEPFADTSALPTYLVSEFAKQKSTVVLTGDGGDELFGGYDWYFQYWNYYKKYIPAIKPAASFFAQIKKGNRYSLLGKMANQLEYRSITDFHLYAKLLGGILPYEKKFYRTQWNIPNDYDDFWYFKKFYINELPLKKRFQYLDFHTYLHDDIFTKVDRASMRVALECRVPFMQKEIVDFAFSLPENIIYYNNQKKGLLKYAFKDILPHNILHRPKRGFNIPLADWNNKFLKDTKTPQELILTLFNFK